jgi:hypothetical protein
VQASLKLLILLSARITGMNHHSWQCVPTLKVDASLPGDVLPQSRRQVSTHHFCDLSNVLSVLPAGKHVGECQGLQTSVDKVRLGGRLLEVLSCSYTQRQMSLGPKTLSLPGFP